jgi:hypothetical protein
VKWLYVLSKRSMRFATVKAFRLNRMWLDD